MADRVRMISKTVFQNDRVTVYREDGPDGGEPGRIVTVGDRFMTDVLHGKELARLGYAEPHGWSLDDVEDPPLEEHHQVSASQLAADRVRRGRKHAGEGPSRLGQDRDHVLHENGPVDGAQDRVVPLSLTGAATATDRAHDQPGAAAVQANRADGLAPLETPTPAAATLTSETAASPAAAAASPPVPAASTPAAPQAKPTAAAKVS